MICLILRFLISIAAIFNFSTAMALPVLQGIVGYGTQTPAGRGGAVIKVTNLNDSGTGSFRACVSASGPRVCVFEVSGYITLTSNLAISNPFLTIAGQTAPSPGITIRGPGRVSITGDDILVQHLRFRPGDIQSCPGTDCNLDGLAIEGSADRVVIDHVSISFSIDGLFDVWGPRTGIHIQNVLMGWPLHASSHNKGKHGYGPAFGSPPHTVGPEISYINNIIMHAAARHPLQRSYKIFTANNIAYNRSCTGQQISSYNGYPFHSTAESNVYVAGPAGPGCGGNIRFNDVEGEFDRNSRMYIANNGHISHPASGNPNDRVLQIPADQWNTTMVQIFGTLETLFGSRQGAIDIIRVPNQTDAVWVPGFTPRPTNQVVAYNTSYAGARPVDRDWVDQTLINDFKTAKGRHINCVTKTHSVTNFPDLCNEDSEVAFSGSTNDPYGWPQMANVTRPITNIPNHPFPTSPNTINTDGYTQLEKWLHEVAKSVEGGGSTPVALAAPRNLSVK